MRRVGTLVVLLLALAAAALCVRLGFWQLGRYHERRARIAMLDAREQTPALEVRAMGDLTPERLGTRVRVHGRIADAPQILLAGRIEQGEPGVALVSVFVLEQGGQVLLERGWLPALDARDTDLRAVAAAGPQTVLALLDSLPSTPRDAQWLPLPGLPARWSVGRLTAAGVREHLGDSLAPLRLTALPEPGAPSAPKRVVPPRPDASMHLSYALQWFLFAAGTLAATVLVAWRRRAARRA